VKLSLKFLKQGFKIKEIFVGLKEYYLFRASGNTKFDKGYVLERKISGDQFPKILNNEWSYDLRIEVPKEKISWTTDRYNINVYHKVKVKIRFGFFSGQKNINLERTVNIENILDNNDLQ